MSPAQGQASKAWPGVNVHPAECQIAKPQTPDQKKGLPEDSARKLGIANLSIPEYDRNLGDGEPALVTEVVHLNLKCIPTRLYLVQIKVFEDSTPEPSEAASYITHGHSQYQARIQGTAPA